MLIQIALLLLWLVIIPCAIGLIFLPASPDAGKYRLLTIAGGYICMWALFQLVAVPVILMDRGEGAFDLLVCMFGVISAAAAFLGAIAGILYRRKTSTLKIVKGKGGINKVQIILWVLFCVLTAFQVYQMAALAFADGDDAYYLAISSITEESGTLYRKLPYTGGSTGLDTRHGLAPFPIWIAFLGRMTGIHTATLSHIFVPIVLLLLAYAIYANIGQILCKDKKGMLPVFMIFVNLLILFGNYSFKSAETFLITRTSQGKAVLGSIIIPFMVLLLFLIIGRLEEGKKTGWYPWLLLSLGSVACCLCSTMGGVLIAILLGVTGLCVCMTFKKWSILPGFAGCTLPALLYIILYLVVQRV